MPYLEVSKTVIYESGLAAIKLARPFEDVVLTKIKFAIS
jgi:hypothetical protein